MLFQRMCDLPVEQSHSGKKYTCFSLCITRDKITPAQRKKKHNLLFLLGSCSEKNFSSSLSRPRTRKTVFYFWHYLFIDSPPANQANFLVLLSKKVTLEPCAVASWIKMLTSNNQCLVWHRPTRLSGKHLRTLSSIRKRFVLIMTHKNFPSATLPQHHNHSHWHNSLISLYSTSLLKLHIELESAPTEVFAWSHTNNNMQRTLN